MIKRIFISTAVFLIFLLLWELYCQHQPGIALALPAPSGILKTLWLRSDRLLMHSIVTLKEMGGGFLLALTAAFPLAWSMYRFKILRSILQPGFVLIQCVPMFALAPLMVLWFGWSYTAIVVPTALMIFFPLTMTIYQGFCSVPGDLKEYFKRHQATPWQTFSKLELPWASPQIAAGFRISAGVAGIGAIAGEWAGGQAGLGILMLESRRGIDLEMTFAALFCLCVISMILYGSMLLVEKRSRLRRFFPLLIALLSLSGCQRAEPKQEVRMLLDWLPNPNHVPLYLGIQTGIFQKHGIDLALLKIHDPADGLAFLAAGNADLALYYMPETYVARKLGAPLTVVGYLVRVPLNAFIYPSDSGIRTPADLQGKSIGYSVGDFGLFALNKMLKENQIVPSHLYNVSFDLVGSLATKRVDALFGAYWNIEIEHLRSLGIEADYLPLEQFGIPLHDELLILAKDGSRTAAPAFIAAFRTALQESIDAAVAHPDRAFEAYIKANPDKGEMTLQWERRAWRRTCPVLAHTQEDNPESWRAFDEWIRD